MGKEVHSRYSQHSDYYHDYSMNCPVKYYTVIKKNRLMFLTQKNLKEEI